MTRIPDPLHAAYDKMPEAEKKKHIEQHDGIAESCEEIFEMCSGYQVQLFPESVRGTEKLYTVRLGCIKFSFAVDRAYSIGNQMRIMELGLGELQRRYEEWKKGHDQRQLERELRKILDLHGVTEARNV